MGIGMMPLIGQLDSSIAGFGSPGPSGVDLICNKAICGSDVMSKHFMSVCLINLIHTSTSPLLWWWYDDDTACTVLTFLQNALNLSEIKLPLASNIIFFGKPYSEKIILQTSIRHSADRSSIFWWLGTCCDNLQDKGSFYCVWSTCPLQLPPMVCLEFHNELFLPSATFPENQDM